MAYIMRIDTTKYKDHKNISRKNWEPGTMDDYILDMVLCRGISISTST